MWSAPRIVTCDTCFPWGPTRVYIKRICLKQGLLENWNWEFKSCKRTVVETRVNRMGIQWRTAEYNREYENENWVQLSVGDSHGKLVVEEQLEVSL
jgi:hypothetical protein